MKTNDRQTARDAERRLRLDEEEYLELLILEALAACTGPVSAIELYRRTGALTLLGDDDLPFTAVLNNRLKEEGLVRWHGNPGDPTTITAAGRRRLKELLEGER